MLSVVVRVEPARSVPEAQGGDTSEGRTVRLWWGGEFAAELQ